MRQGYRVAAGALVVVLGVSPLACTKARHADAAPAGGAVRAPTREDLVEVVYDGALKNSWQDWGWSNRKTTGPGPAQVHFNGWGGLILAKPGIDSSKLGALVFRVKEPHGEAEFLEVRVESSAITTFPRIKVGAEHRADVGDEWFEIRIPMWELDPDGMAFDRVIIRAFRDVSDQVTLFDHVGFTAVDPDAGAGAASRLDPLAYSPSTTHKAPAHISCDQKATKISPLIYGIAYYAQNADAPQQWQMAATARRWGGNNMTRYNWQISAFNLDADWFYENHDTRSYAKFIEENQAHGMKSVLTIPTIGWAPKDTSSVAFPVSVLGPQEKTDPYKPEAGNGNKQNGEKMTPLPATQTSIEAPPAYEGAWVAAIRAHDAKTGKRSVDQYILDNEPQIWSTNHRDVHPEPLGYDEILERTIAYGSAIRKADPDAVIAGPADWGWPAYFYSGKDGAAGFFKKPDRRAHGDQPLIEWYLQKLREHEQKTGERVLNVLDEHYYPQSGYQGPSDPKNAALRIRATRSLWDPTYVDESWIKEPVRLLPRMKEWIAKFYPEMTGISLGEWNFGGEDHISGAIATAEVLGRFGQFGAYSAYYWTFPAAGSPVIQAFLAFRNFDGAGGHFLDWYVPSTAPEGTSLFVSRDEAGTHLVAVAINTSPDTATLESMDLAACGQVVSHRSFAYFRGATKLTPAGASDKPGPWDQILPPWSIVVMDMKLAAPITGPLEK